MGTRTAVSVARRSPSTPFIASPPPATGLKLLPARTGDHGLIHRLLVSVFHGPSAAEFHAQLDEPGYDPADRLVVKDREQVAAHLRLARQTVHAARVTLPAVRFMDLATEPEYRSRGLATALIMAGERKAIQQGALVALTRTRVPQLFADRGWAVCGRHFYSSAAPRAVLAELGATAAGNTAGPGQPAKWTATTTAHNPVAVRPLRRIEMPALIGLYARCAALHSGWPVRSDEYWDWLLARGAFDQVYVAARGGESAELPELLDSIMGYAFVRQSRLVEVVAAPGRDDVARTLAARVCADASEQNEWLVRCDAPPTHPLHALFRQAGGKIMSCEDLNGEQYLAKLLDPLAALRRMAELLWTRAREADLPRPSELGLELRGASRDRGVVERFRLQFTRQSVRIETGGPSKHAIALRAADLAPLLLGGLAAEDLLAAGRLRATSRQSRQFANAIFPTRDWWRPLLDDLLA